MTPVPVEYKDGEREEYDKPCPKCGGKTYIERSGKHIKWSCVACGYLKFLPQRWDLFHVPFGRYAGTVLGELVEVDPEYVRWAAANMTNKSVKRAFCSAVEAMDTYPREGCDGPN